MVGYARNFLNFVTFSPIIFLTLRKIELSDYFLIDLK